MMVNHEKLFKLGKAQMYPYDDDMDDDDDGSHYKAH